MTTAFDLISQRIIKEQELIIGPMAWEEARKVNGLSVVDTKQGVISIMGDGKQIVDALVSRYVKLFGKASQEACKESVQDLLADMKAEDVPAMLK
ncbi:MAG: hypothetical protein KA028_01180 [Candidatus Pacebacteria bacterium]|nr:hypothetical protein [Candidatus Paceibacterota bacterium]MBP9851762.1 hypothetical protein [Candidatus Paceibacterota bacterium]